MTGMAAGLLIALLAGQMPALPGGGGEAPAPPKLHVVAAHASNAGQEPAAVDEALSAVKKILLALPFDTYAPVADQEVEAPPGEETLIPLNGIYSLYVTPQGQDETGALALTARISMLKAGSGPEEYVNALYTEAKLASGMPLVFRGLDLNVGELVVVLRLSGDDNQQGQSQNDESDQQEQENEDQKQEQESGSDNDQQQQQDNPQDQEQQNDSAPQAQEETPDLQNIEALLQSLEETDRKEQEEQQRVRSGIRVRGDWW